MVNKSLGFLLLAVLAVWGVVSLAASAGLYKLWWERERVLYLGKTVAEQRLQVFRLAGLPEALDESARQLPAIWPEDVTYTVAGDHNHLSYLKYLLIPRLPSGSDSFRIDDRGEAHTADHGGATHAASPQAREQASPIALFVPLFLLSGITLALKRAFRTILFSFPELFGVSLLLCMVLVVGARVVFATAVPAFSTLVAIGCGCWLWLIYRWFGQQPSCSRLAEEMAGHFPAHTPLLRLVALILLSYIVVNGIWVVLMSVVVVPDDWDAWAIWGAKAKVLALGTGPLTDVALFGHADYPLLWPALWAFSGWFGGGWEEMWSKGWGAVLLMLCAWEIAVIIKRLTGQPTLALLGAALLVSMPMVTVIASWGYAETPFWLLLITCAGCLTLRENSQSPVVLVVAALLAVAAAYTKNEGVLFAGVAALWLLVLPGRNRLGAMLLFAGIIVACYLPWLSWKHFVLQAGSHATAGLHFDLESIHRAWQRLAPASEGILKMWADPRQWNIVLWLCGASLLFGVYWGVRRVWLLPPIAICLVYLLIVLFHEAEIYWQVGTAWNRLTVHFLPFLVVYLTLQFSAILNPDKDNPHVLSL